MSAPTVETFEPGAPGEQLVMRAGNRLAVVEVYATVQLVAGLGGLAATAHRVVGRRTDGAGREYVARLGACLRDDCVAGRTKFCPKPNNHVTAVNAWLRHSATHCHGWHEPSLMRFVGEVLATYGSAGSGRTRAVGVPRGSYRPSDWGVPS